MRIWKTMVLFYIGGTAYMTLEFLWRGRSHGSMFILGGVCFLLLGSLARHYPRIPPAGKAMMGAAMITALELVTGLLVNRQYAVWDYRSMPFHFMGHICLPFSLLWIPLSLFGMQVNRAVAAKLPDA